MVGRILTWLIVIVLLVVGWKNGVLEAIRSGCVPEVGREGTVDGPIKGKGVPVAIESEILMRELDTHTGGNSSSALQTLYESGDLALLPAHTRIKVMENKNITVQLVPYKICKIRILSGNLKNVDVWIERPNVIDNPMQQLFQAIRQKPDAAPADSSSSK